jgi:hypothetical protein
MHWTPTGGVEFEGVDDVLDALEKRLAVLQRRDGVATTFRLTHADFSRYLGLVDFFCCFAGCASACFSSSTSATSRAQRSRTRSRYLRCLWALSSYSLTRGITLLSFDSHAM